MPDRERQSRAASWWWSVSAGAGDGRLATEGRTANKNDYATHLARGRAGSGGPKAPTSGTPVPAVRAGAE